MFSSGARLFSSIAALTLALSVSAQADDGVRLSTVAAENGFTYQWLSTEAGATLVRPGVRIVIRAGRMFYEVNNATPSADSAPRFDGRDLVISPKLADHLRLLALKYPYQALGAADSSMSAAPSATASAPATLTIKARHIPGREAIALSGAGPANVPVTITLSGEMSTDLPIVVLSRTTIITATDGSFSAEMNYGQDTHAKTSLAATATLLSGASPAQARVVIGLPSPHIKSSGLDDWPKK